MAVTNIQGAPDPVNVKIMVKKGATFDSLILRYKVNGSAVALVTDGWSAKMQVKKSDADGNPLGSPLLTITDAGDITMNDSGEVQPVITDENTNALGVGTFVTDLFLYDSAGASRPIMEGTLVIEASVTEP